MSDYLNDTCISHLIRPLDVTFQHPLLLQNFLLTDLNNSFVSLLQSETGGEVQGDT